MKTLTEILRTRRSVRRFDERPVGREIIEGLLELTLTAPSSKNVRSSRFVVVADREKLARISQMRDFGSAFLADAPCAVLVCGDCSGTDLWLDNAAISATVLQLAAQEAGLGSCWVHVNGRPQRRDEPDGPNAADYIREVLPTLPAEWHPLCVIALGYPAEPSRERTPKDDSEKIMWVQQS